MKNKLTWRPGEELGPQCDGRPQSMKPKSLSLEGEEMNEKDIPRHSPGMCCLGVDFELSTVRAKLAVAVEALEYYANADLVCRHPTRVIFDRAKEALAKIKETK